MLYQLFGIILIISSFSLNYVSPARDKVVCYYQSWKKASYPPEEVNTQICTHVNYAFLGVNADGGLRLDGDDDVLRRVSNLKHANPNLKVLISVGGWNEGSEKFSQIAANPQKKANFAGSVNYFLSTYNYDGIDVDWEYPGQRGGGPADKENFVDMLRVLRHALPSNKLLTLAVSADPVLYNVREIAKYTNFINIMTYDFHNPSEGRTGQNAPLYASAFDTSDWQKTHLNCDSAITNWLNAGANPGHLLLGLAFYGRSFELKDRSNHRLGAPCVGPGLDGGHLDYKRICTFGSAQGWVDEWDDQQKVPIKYAGDQWIGYDNPQSIAIKVKYAKNRGLGGVMVWAVDQDDKNAACGTKNPLLQTIKNNL